MAGVAAAAESAWLFYACVLLWAGAWGGAMVRRSGQGGAGARHLELLAGIAANSTDCIIVESLSRVVISWNAEAERTFVYTEAEAVGRCLTDLIVPADRLQEDRDFLARIAEGKRVTPLDTLRMRRDGSLIDVSIAAVPIFGADGHIAAMAKTIRDISKRKAAEQALKVSNAHLEEEVNRSSGQLQSVKRDLSTILDVLPSMIGYWDKNLVNRMANRAFARWFDVHPIALPGMHLRELLGEDLMNQDMPLIQAVLNGETVTYERTLPGRTGAGPGHVLLNLVPDAQNGEVLGFYLLGHDITAHREAQRRLAESEKFLQRAETVSRVGGFMIDLDSGEHQWTRQSYRIHDVDESCPPTQALVDGMLAPEVRRRVHEAIRAARETGVGYDIEIPLVTPGKRELWIRMAGEVESIDGVPQRIVGAIQDITERCKLEQRLRDAIAVADKASRSKSEFLANMSHEIRTPLNAVIGLGYLLEQTSLNDDQRSFLTKIQFAGRSLLGVINNVLDLSKIEADEMSLEDAAFDLPELLHDVSQMLLPLATGKGIGLNARTAATLPHIVMGDALRVRQILTNLLNNAIKFTERGQVDLVAYCIDQGVGRVRLRCEVIDTGIGIEPAACERLFMPFTQADASTTRRFGGTGLGLSIARRFVELMGGEIGVTSRVGGGSTFWIEIPLRLAPDRDGRLTSNALRVLIVDPRGDTPQGLGAMVRALGWNPHVVDCGEQMLRLMGANGAAAPDALIIDLHGAASEAHALVARLPDAGAGAEISAIIVAESAESYLEHKALARSSDVLLVRPVTSSALFNAINLAVSRQPESSDRIFESTNFDELHAQWLAGVQVLVVDDSDINLEVAQRILEKQGAKVATCSDGSSALDYLRDHRSDIVLMDVQMPVLDGNAATRCIREDLRLTELPIMALTAGALVGERQRSLDAGMNDFVSKPFDPQVLIRKVRRLVEAARGEPIPMVFDDKAGAVGAGNRLFLKSIDAGVVQQMFGDEIALFKSLLKRMLREYADMALPLSVGALESADRATLKGRAHKLKGSAGMIGATSVVRFAAAAERALQEDRPSDAVEAILRKLAAALTTLREEFDQMTDAQVQAPNALPSPAGASTGASADPAALKELCDLLDSQNLAAVDAFAALAGDLERRLGGERFGIVSNAVENLDFQIAAEALRHAGAGEMNAAA